MKKSLCFFVAFVILSAYAGLFASAAGEALTVVAFGDSITAAGKWQSHIEKEYGFKVINAGVGGDTTNTAKARFKSAVINKDPDMVFISLGINDCAIDMSRYVDIDTYKANMAYFIDECIKIGAKVIVNIPTPVVDEQYLTRHDSAPFEPYGGPNGIVSVYAEAAREVAREKKVIFADLNAYFSSLGDYSKYFPDGVHPSDAGYKMYAQVAIDALKMLFLGDVNYDTVVDSYDYILVKRLCMKTVTLDEKQRLSADVNCDGLTDTFDYILLKRHCMGTYKIGQ